jgi:hypothetical protein
MASESRRALRASCSSNEPNAPPAVIVIRSTEPQQRFVAQALETLELLTQHETRKNEATSAMDIGFRIEAEAAEHGYTAITAAARALSTQAAELYLTHRSAGESKVIKYSVDLLSMLLLRVYLTGTDSDSLQAGAAPPSARRRYASDRCIH